MNILIFYPFLLHSQVKHGGGVHLLRLVRQLNSIGHKLYLLCLAEADPQPYLRSIEPVRQMCKEYCIIQRPKLTPFLKTVRFFSPGIPPHPRNLVHPEAQAYIRELTTSGKVDLVHLVHTASGEYLHAVDRDRCAVTLDADDFETRHYATILQHERNPIRWLHAYITLLRARPYERRLMESVDHVLAITAQEKASIQELSNSTSVEVIPPMIDLQDFPLPENNHEVEEGALVFIGSFSHSPNIDAVNWFCREIFPSILARVPSAHFYIVGWKAQEVVGDLAGPHIQVIGSVDNIIPWLRKAAVIVSPIRSGGGVRIKNIEALASGRPLVTTLVGAEGLVDLPDRGFLSADEAPRFADFVVELLSNHEYRDKLGRQGRAMVERFHDVNVVGMKLNSLFTRVKAAHNLQRAQKT